MRYVSRYTIKVNQRTRENAHSLFGSCGRYLDCSRFVFELATFASHNAIYRSLVRSRVISPFDPNPPHMELCYSLFYSNLPPTKFCHSFIPNHQLWNCVTKWMLSLSHPEPPTMELCHWLNAVTLSSGTTNYGIVSLTKCCHSFIPNHQLWNCITLFILIHHLMNSVTRSS
jgi:hypothetical protein